MKKLLKDHYPYILILSAVSFTYLFYLNATFVYDDYLYVTHNPYIKISNLSLNRLYLAITGLKVEAIRPVYFLSLALNYYFSGISPHSFHFINILIHLLNAFLLFWIFSKIINNTHSRFFLTLTLMIWAVHPVHIMAVIYTAARSETLCVFFGLLGFYFYIKFRETAKNDKNKFYHIYFVSFIIALILSLFTKEIGIIFPFLIFSYDLLFYQNRKNIISRKNILVFVLCFIPVLIIQSAGKIIFQKTIVSHYQNINTEYYVPLGEQLSAKFSVFLKYFECTFIPFSKTYALDHLIKYNNSSILNAISIAFFCSATGIIIYLVRKNKNIILFNYLVLILPLSFYVLPFPLRLFDEYRLYFPLIGLTFIFCLLINKIMAKFSNVLLIIITLFLMVNSHIRLNDWQSAENLWKLNLKKYPDNWRALSNYGKELIDNGKYESGLIYSEQALKYKQKNSQIHFQMGLANAHLENLDSAKKYFIKALEYDSSNDSAAGNLGVIFAREKKYKKAIRYFNDAVNQSPLKLCHYKNLSVLYQESKNYSEAIKIYQKILKLNPENNVSFDMAACYFNNKNYEEAKRYFLISKKQRSKFNEQKWINRCNQMLAKKQ